MAVQVDDVLAVDRAFYHAHETRDLEAMSAVWDHGPRSVCVHPAWPIMRGWPMIEESWRQIFNGPRRNQFILTNVTVSMLDHIAWITVDENIVDGPKTSTIAATNVYAETAAGWRMVLHHASLVTDDPRTR